jgi:hypothetical protein
LHERQKEIGKERGTQIVGAELELVAIFRDTVGMSHYPCIVDQHIKSVVLAKERVGCLLD